jgi:hypothetical protein
VTSVITLDGIDQRIDSFRFEVLDKNLTIIGEVGVENSGVTIENNINREIKRQINNLRIPPADGNEINILTDRIRPYMVMQDNSQWPLGVFVFSDSSTIPMTGTVGFSETTLLDQAIELNQPLNRSYAFRPGTNIGTAMERILEASTISQFEVEPGGAVIRGTEWVAWPAGTTRLEILNDLAETCGCYSLFFDNTGVARVIEVPDLASTDATLRYGSTEEDEKRVVEGSIVITDDLISAPNRYIVINSALTEKAVVGFWDIPATSPNSIANIGRVVAHVTDKQGVDTDAEATKAAKAVGQADFNTFSWATFDAAPDPRHDTFDIVSWEGVNYREQSWTLTLGGTMRHELRRIFNEPINV